MAALKPDQLEIDADGATARPPGTRVTGSTLPRYLSGGAVRTQLTAGPPARIITAPYRR